MFVPFVTCSLFQNKAYSFSQPDHDYENNNDQTDPSKIVAFDDVGSFYSSRFNRYPY